MMELAAPFAIARSILRNRISTICVLGRTLTVKLSWNLFSSVCRWAGVKLVRSLTFPVSFPLGKVRISVEPERFQNVHRYCVALNMGTSVLRRLSASTGDDLSFPSEPRLAERSGSICNRASPSYTGALRYVYAATDAIREPYKPEWTLCA